MVLQWKPVQIDAGLISSGVEGLVGIEELTHYELKSDKHQSGRLIRATGFCEDITKNHVKKKNKQKNSVSGKKRKYSVTVAESDNVAEECGSSKRKKKQKLKTVGKRNVEADVQSVANKLEPALSKKQKKKRKLKIVGKRTLEAGVQSVADGADPTLSSEYKKKRKSKTVARRTLEADIQSAANGADATLSSEYKKKRKLKTVLQRSAETGVRPAASRADSALPASDDGEEKLSIPKGMEAWNGLNVPYPVLRALSEQGFKNPTKIQALALPPAIFGRRDILGAAETGSGKTLAFGIPIIYGILIQKNKDASNAVQTQDKALVGNDEGEETVVDEAVSDSGIEESEDESLVDIQGGMGCVKVVDNISLEQFVPVTVPSGSRRKLYALILTPTRELAIQVKNHLVAAAKYTDIKVAVVVGGMASQKQERVLSKGPEIVVATPGRLWELIQEGNSHLMQINDIRYLAIDETDRMVEKGHFQELHQLLERLNMDADKRKHRQNFVFSATLTLVHDPPVHIIKKKGGKKPTRITPGQKLNSIIEMLGITNPKVVDVTNKTATAELLSEACIHCEFEEKDSYLYYLLQKHAGRTLVFCNSIGCVRRLAHLLGLLRCQPLPLHANMIQRQRLKNLDRFRSNPGGLLLATDVAARGLDIPGVEHVIHYQVPRTSESYVHRSGRTARAQNAGITILLIEPSEVINYTRLCRTLGRDQQLPQFPINESYMSAVKQRVVLARELDQLELSLRRTSSEASWLQKTAKAMDLLLDDDDLPNKQPDTDVLESTAKHKRVLAFKRKQLAALLDKPIFPKGFIANHPTLGKQQLAVGENALEALSASLGETKNKKKRKYADTLDAVRLARQKRRRKQRRQKKMAVD